MLTRLLVIIAALAIILAFVLEINAEPFLVYNPTVNIIRYQVDVNGSVEDLEPNVIDGGTLPHQLVYDLANIPPGVNTVRARALFDVWGWCPWSEPFIINRPLPLTNPQVVTNP